MADEVLQAVITAEGVKAFQEDLDRANKSVVDMETATQRAGESLQAMDAAAKQAKATLEKVGVGNMTEVSAEVAKLVEEMQKLREQYGLAASAMIATGDAALDAAGKAVKFGQESKDAAKESASAAKDAAGEWKRLFEIIAGFSVGQIAIRIFDKLREEIASTRTLFQAQEDAVVSLGIAYGSMGKFQTAAIQDMQKWAAELQKATAYGDEAILSTAALIAQLGRITGDELKGATEAAVQFAAVLGRDLTTTALLLAKAAQNQTQELSRYGVVLREGIPASEKFAEVLRLINQNFGGTAQLRARTMSGQVRALSAAWGDAKEAFGAASAAWIPTLQKMTAAFAAVAEKINPNFLRVFDTTAAVNDLVAAFEEQSRATQQATRDFITYKQIGGATGQQMTAIYANLGKEIQQSAKDAREAVKQKGEVVRDVIRFKLNQGDVTEIKAQIAEIKRALAAATDPESVSELLKLLEAGVAHLRLRIQLDKDAFTEDVRHLRDIAQRIPLEIEASFVTRPVDAYLAELERRRPEITAELNLEPGALADLQSYEQTVRLEAPDLPLDQFVQLGNEARDAFIAAFQKPDKTPADWDKILRMGDLLRFLETLRIPRIPIEFEWQGPQFVEPDLGPVNRIEREFEFLKKSVEDLGKLGQISPGDLIDIEGMKATADNLETLRGKIIGSVEAIKASVEGKLATIRLEAVDKLKAAGDDQAARAQIIAEADRAQTEALAPLVEAYRALVELENLYIQQLGMLPATSAAAIGKSKQDLEGYVKAWQAAHQGNVASLNQVVGTATSGFDTIAIVGKATEDSLVAAFKDGSDKTVAIVTAMVNEILEQLARLTIRSFFEDLATTVAVGAVVGKVEVPNTPIEVPVEPVVPDGSGVAVFEGQVLPPPAPKPMPIDLEPILPEDLPKVFSFGMVLEAPRPPTFRNVQVELEKPEVPRPDPIPVFLEVPELRDLRAGVELQKPEAPSFDPIPLLFEKPDSVDLSVLVQKPDAPTFDPVPLLLEPVLPAGTVDVPGKLSFAQVQPASIQQSSLEEFTREIQAGARAREARPVEVRVIQEAQEPQTLNVTLSGVNDGLSVRRQLTSGALRREILREASRGRL